MQRLTRRLYCSTVCFVRGTHFARLDSCLLENSKSAVLVEVPVIGGEFTRSNVVGAGLSANDAPWFVQDDGTAIQMVKTVMGL